MYAHFCDFFEKNIKREKRRRRRFKNWKSRRYKHHCRCKNILFDNATMAKINNKNTLRINALVWFDGKENAPQIQEYFLPTDVKNEAFYEKIDWDRKENNDGWEFGGDWEHQFNKTNSFKLRAVFTKENEDQEDVSLLNDTINFYNNNVYVICYVC